MKEQYVGDINDYRKYALLRALSDRGAVRIGVCWMLTSSDGSADGNKLAYLRQPERYREFDPELFDILAHSVAEPQRRRLRSIEESGALPGAVYHNDLLGDDLDQRQDFIRQCSSEFRDVDLAFFDPDNGLETKLPKGRKNSNKYVYLDELTGFYESGKSLLVYQHFPRIERKAFMASCAERILTACPHSAVWAFTTAHVVFFLIVHPDSRARLAIAAMECCDAWDEGFMRGRYIGKQADN